MSYYSLDIFTPHKVMAKGLQADSLLIPAVEGQINILEEHTHIITCLENGELIFSSGDLSKKRYFLVSDGICKVVGREVKILVTFAEESHEIDSEAARKTLGRIEAELYRTDLLLNEKIKALGEQRRMAQLRIQVAEHANVS